VSTTETLQMDTAQLQRWTVDTDRSTVEFEVRHGWGLSAVTGRFRQFGGWYVVRSGQSSLELAVDSASIDTGNAMRDKHLRSDDFFDAGEHPWIRFTSTDVVDEGHGKLHVSGVLNVAGTQVPLSLVATKRQFADELEIEATGTVDQSDFGMSSGPLWSIRRPSKVHVKARMTPSLELFG
jgi:polyisoprenoid-binding protein YceI